MKLILATHVEEEKDTVFLGFDLELFKKLAPPLMPMSINRFDGCKKGDEIHLELGPGKLTGKWVSVVTEVCQSSHESFFVDEGKVLPWPLRSWRHTHRVMKKAHGSIIRDEIEYRAVHPILEWTLYPLFYAMFEWRRPIYRRTFKKS